jgi:GNAT superfamily N-acetyltransferase
MPTPKDVIVVLKRAHLDQLKAFFEDLQDDPDGIKKFHPHPFSGAAAAKTVSYHGKDMYLATIENEEIIAYGMLRGWDEGFERPSLGVIVRPDKRNQGYGTKMIKKLVEVATQRKAPAVIFKIHKTNEAVNLFERLGFHMEDYDNTQFVGTMKL